MPKSLKGHWQYELTSRIQSRKQKKIKVREKEEKKSGKKSCIADCKFHYVQKYSGIERDAIYFHLIVIFSLLPENFGSKICQIHVENNFSVAAVVYADGICLPQFFGRHCPPFLYFFSLSNSVLTNGVSIIVK